jgi:hypothetical protein
MENAMTKYCLSRSASSGLLATAAAAVLMAAAPMTSASAQTVGHGAYGYRNLEANSDCGTFLAQPGYASGFTAQACQGVVRGGASTVASRHSY